VRQVCVGAYAHQDLPFEKLVEELLVHRDLSRNPLFQVTFQLSNLPREAVEFPNMEVDYLQVDNGTTKFDLSLFMVDEGHELKGSLGYNVDLFDAATIEQMLSHFQALLECIVKNPDHLLSMIAILTDDKRNEWRTKWTDVKKEPVDVDESLASRVKLSERQAIFSPAKQALLKKRLQGEPIDGS
jgi:non-ribosomal peptide synthetase component F